MINNYHKIYSLGGKRARGLEVSLFEGCNADEGGVE